MLSIKVCRMLRNLIDLIRSRVLIQSLVVRELKARYRGSVLGFFWSFVNPLLQLLIYTFVFAYVLPGRFQVEPYPLFLFTGILPWTWFSSSGKIHWPLVFFPAVVLLQLVFTLGVCLFFSALSVHFRDVQNILANLLMLWFFSSPVIYPYLDISPNIQRWLNYNPMTHILVGYHQTLLTCSLGHWPWLLLMSVASVVTFLVGYAFFDRLRDTYAEEV